MAESATGTGAASLAGAFIVRILGPGGRTAGVGALVGPREIVTCAHVVNGALGLDLRAQAQPSEVVPVEFPLAQADAIGLPQFGARVERWLPPARAGAAGDDVAGLVLTDSDVPSAVTPARLSVNVPSVGRGVRVFGYPGVPPRPDGAWVPVTVRGRIGGGRLQLDSATDAALRVQPGYSGSPVYDDDAGLVVGMLASAPAGQTAERDSYAIDTNRLRLAWPEVFERRRAAGGAARKARPGPDGTGEITLLHVSDPQFGKHHLFGGNGLTQADWDHDTLFSRLHDDLAGLASEHQLRPGFVVVTGDLAEWGLRSEFEQVTEFLGALSEAAAVPRHRMAIVPGNHDVNRKACEAYFAQQQSDEEDPVPPYWPKWRQFAAAFTGFYADVHGVTFTPDEPWTLFEMPDLAVVVAGLNSTMAESHREADHYGSAGEHQLRWFAERLADYRDRGWLRLAAVHHNVVRGAACDEENLRDADDLDRLIGEPGLANLLLHGHTHDGRMHRLGSGLVALSTGSAAVDAEARPTEIPNQYQLVTVRRDGFTRYARQYALGQRRWIGDTRISRTGSDWRDIQAHELTNVDAAFPPPPDLAAGDQTAATGDGRAITGERRAAASERRAAAGRAAAVRRDSAGHSAVSAFDDFLDRVAQATRVRFPAAAVTVRAESGYLRVLNPLPSGGAETWPVGVTDGPDIETAFAAFAEGVHARFASADPSVRSEFVCGGPPTPEHLVALARQRGVRLRSFVDYQGLLDLRPLADRQRDRLAADPVYPARLYVPQRYRIACRRRDNEVRAGLLDQVVSWLGQDDAQLIMVLGDFGRGKTSLLRQLARTLPGELPGLLPVLVELRSLEKAPTLDELLGQHLIRHGVEDISPAKLRYMISSGRLALLFDGFDELELRVGYDNAADYLQTLLESVTDRAKIVLTSRTQHFQSTDQVRTALGERVATMAASRVVVLEDFSEEQVREFLTNLYGGDGARADARFSLMADIEDLLGLARNPRMLAFIAALDEERLRTVQREEGRISAADLYREIVDFWLIGEADRQRHRGGIQSFDDKERLSACTALALRLWMSKAPTIGLADLSAEVSGTLTRLAERGYNAQQASHSIASGSLLVRTDDGAFTFVHQSIMEWLVADAAARTIGQPGSAQILTTRRMSRLMVDFFGDLAGHSAARQWATAVLADPESSEAAKQNALAVQDRVRPADTPKTAQRPPQRQNLAGVDLRGQDLTGRDLRDADLRGADLRNMRLEQTDFSGADLRDADFTGARLIGGSLRGTLITGSRWHRAAALGVDGVEGFAGSSELLAAAVAGRDPAECYVSRPSESGWAVAISPDGSMLAVGRTFVELVNIADGRPIRILGGHEGGLIGVNGVAFSPDGALLATASADGAARIWDTATGAARTTLTGHEGTVNGVAFSPDGALLATASADGTARIWDTATGKALATLLPLPGNGYAVLTPEGYKLDGDPGDRLWWAIKLCRFEPGELDPYVPGIVRLPADAPIIARSASPAPARRRKG